MSGFSPSQKGAAHPPDAGQSYQEVLDSKTVLEMVYIPSGEFLMDSPADSSNVNKVDAPDHRVAVSAFYHRHTIPSTMRLRLS